MNDTVVSACAFCFVKLLTLQGVLQWNLPVAERVYEICVIICSCCHVCQASVLKSLFTRRCRENGQYYWLMRVFLVNTCCKLATNLTLTHRTVWAAPQYCQILRH